MKRITSFTLTILIICGITVTAAAYEYAEDGDFNPDIFAALKLNGRFGEYTLSDIMTKGEFAAVIAGIVTNGAAVGTETLILDETPLKLSGALLSAVKALGYSEYMDKMGGYTAIAGNLGLTAGVKADADGSLTFGAASRLVYNSLTASKFEISTYGENLQYEKTGRTFLDDMRLVKIDGIVVETKYTSVDRALTEKQVKLKYSYNERLSGGKTSRKSNMEDIFLTNSPETASYIGKRIIAFVSGFGENGMNIEFAFPYGNTATKIRHDEFAAFNNETFSFSYRVKDTDRDRSFKISYYAAVLINGIKRTSDIILPNENMFKDFDPRYKQFGYISLIDNNSDGVIDFIFVENYQDYFVSNTAVTQSEIRLDDSFWAKPVYIETSFIGDGVTIVDADGNPFDYRDIAKNDVISLMDGHTENGYLKSGKIVVSRETRQGRISSLSPKTDSDGELEIDGIPYDYVVIDTKKPKNYIPAINDEGKFYLDFFSRVVYKDVRSSFSTQYGLLYKLACESKIDSDMKAKIFTDAGIWAVYGFAKHISVRDETNVYAGDKTSYSRENLKARLLGNQKSKTEITVITYSLNDGGEIREIAFAQDNIDWPVNKYSVTLDRIFNQPSDDGKPFNPAVFNKNVFSIGDAYLSEGAPVFNIGRKGRNTGIFDKTMELDEGQVTVFKTGDIQNNAAPYIMGYDLTDGNEISAALTVDFAKQAEIYGSVGVVTGIADVSFDGGAAKKIYAVKDGEKVDFILPEDVLAENRTELEFGNIPRKGDIIEYALDEAGAAAQIAIVFRLSIAKNYMPDFDGDGTADVDSPSVNFYTDSADAANTVKYYYGLAAAQTAGTRFSKIQVNLDDEIISDNAGYISKLPITAMLAANENTNIYNYSENNPNCIKNIRFSDIIVDPTRLGDRRTGDLVFIKTVNGLATDIITVNP